MQQVHDADELKMDFVSVGVLILVFASLAFPFRFRQGRLGRASFEGDNAFLAKSPLAAVASYNDAKLK